jgi:hypothetical protein
MIQECHCGSMAEMGEEHCQGKITYWIECLSCDSTSPVDENPLVVLEWWNDYAKQEIEE